MGRERSLWEKEAGELFAESKNRSGDEANVGGGGGGGGKTKRSVNQSQAWSLSGSVKSNDKQTQMNEVFLDHQLNWAVNQTGKLIAWKIKKGPTEETTEITARSKRIRRSPRGRPYWLDPANNLVVDDPPPPEVSFC